MSTQRPETSPPTPALFRGLIDDAAVFPPGSAPLPDAITEHRSHRAAWYADMVGPVLVPASLISGIGQLLADDERIGIGIVGDTGLAGLPTAMRLADHRLRIGQIEVAVAKRGEDPQPGLEHLLGQLAGWPAITGYAEIPLTSGLLGALDTVARARSRGVDIAAKFRTGGLAAELFPTPIELAAVICACRERDLPFKLTAGLHHAIRHADPETGFVHHGFLNVLAATITAVDAESEVADVAEHLASADAVPLVEIARRCLDGPRPLWIGFGTCSIQEPIADLARLGLLTAPVPAGPGAAA